MARSRLSLPLLAAVGLPGVAASLPTGVIAVPLTRDLGQSAYYAEFQVGTPPQTEYLKVDTGSPRYAFLDSRNPVCSRDSQPCKTFGTFDNTTSSTSRYAGPYFQDALISYGGGDYLNDTIVLGGVSSEDMYFGYVSRYAFPERVTGDISTILGLSLECSFAGPNCTYKGAYLLPQLKNASKIDYMASSIYLGPDDAEVPNAKMLLGGSYDKAKVDGELFTVEMVDPFDLHLTSGQTNVANVTALEVVLDGGNRTFETYGEPGVGTPVLLDTGIARWYFPTSIFNVVFSALGGSGEVQLSNPYQVVDCKYRDPNSSQSYISVEFGTTGKIKVPLHTLVSKLADGTCASFIGPRGDVPSTLGDPFLRGTYSIFDQENFSISLGHVRHTDEEEIVKIPREGFNNRN